MNLNDMDDLTLTMLHHVIYDIETPLDGVTINGFAFEVNQEFKNAIGNEYTTRCMALAKKQAMGEVLPWPNLNTRVY